MKTLLILTVLLVGCGNAQRLTRSNVSSETNAVISYTFDRELHVREYSPAWYDSAHVFGQIDTTRTTGFMRSVERWRSIDSSNRFTTPGIRAQREMLLHHLAVLKLTADSTHE